MKLSKNSTIWDATVGKFLVSLFSQLMDPEKLMWKINKKLLKSKEIVFSGIQNERKNLKMSVNAINLSNNEIFLERNY